MPPRTFNDISGSYVLPLNPKTSKLERIPYPAMHKNSISLVKTYNIRDDYSADTISNFEISGDWLKYVLEGSFSSSEDNAKKLLMVFNRTNPQAAQAHYEGINFKSRIAAKLKGTEKSSGEVVIQSAEGKKYFLATPSISLQGFRVFQRAKA